MAFVSIVTPPFDAQYAARSFIATSPSTEPILTIAPPPHFRNSGSSARDTRNGPFTFTVIMRSHSSSLIPSTVETCNVPALFTSTFSRPNRSTVPFTARSTSRARVTSHSIANPAPPCFWISLITSRSFSSRRPATVTLAPSRANASAIARPIPVPPPVISATLPESRVTDFPIPASNRGVAPPPHVPRGARDSSIQFPAPQAGRTGRKMLYLSGSYSHDGDPKAYPMRIGITCYPTYGGSGVVATELGMELAARGHDIHFISYAPPIRMNANDPRIHFHEVEVVSYPLFD